MSSPNNSSNQSFWTSTRIGLTALAIIVIAAVVSAYFQGHPGESAPPAVSQMSFKLLNGQSLKLADYTGKVVVVNLWATWCGPCRQEIPHLVEMANEYKSKGVEVVGLSTEDPQTEEPSVRSFTQEFNINYSIGWANPELADGLMNGRNGIPQMIVIGRDGKIKKHFVGFNPRSSPNQMRAALDEALAEG